MEYVAIITILALLQYFSFGFMVGQNRQRTKEAAIDAPEDLQLKRAIRVHLHTGEYIIIFLPFLFLCAHYADARFAAGCGVIWLIGRAMFRAGYMKDGTSRTNGFFVTLFSLVLLLIGAIYGIAKSLIGF